MIRASSLRDFPMSPRRPADSATVTTTATALPNARTRGHRRPNADNAANSPGASGARPATTPRGARAAGTARPAYHHGDLRQALLDAAEAVLAEQGVSGVTLRECARRAGVSHGAPAHHFGDVGGLLRALRGNCFAQFAAHRAAARDAAPARPFEQLVAIGLAYVDFALRHPEQFRLMFGSAKLGQQEGAQLGTGDRGYQVLLDCIAATDRAAGGDGSLTEEKAVLAHTLVHGFGSLVLENPTFYSQLRSDPARAGDFLARLLRLARPAFEATRVSTPD